MDEIKKTGSKAPDPIGSFLRGWDTTSKNERENRKVDLLENEDKRKQEKHDHEMMLLRQEQRERTTANREADKSMKEMSIDDRYLARTNDKHNLTNLLHSLEQLHSYPELSQNPGFVSNMYQDLKETFRRWGQPEDSDTRIDFVGIDVVERPDGTNVIIPTFDVYDKTNGELVCEGASVDEYGHCSKENTPMQFSGLPEMMHRFSDLLVGVNALQQMKEENDRKLLFLEAEIAKRQKLGLSKGGGGGTDSPARVRAKSEARAGVDLQKTAIMGIIKGIDNEVKNLRDNYSEYFSTPEEKAEFTTRFNGLKEMEKIARDTIINNDFGDGEIKRVMSIINKHIPTVLDTGDLPKEFYKDMLSMQLGGGTMLTGGEESEPQLAEPEPPPELAPEPVAEPSPEPEPAEEPEITTLPSEQTQSGGKAEGDSLWQKIKNLGRGEKAKTETDDNKYNKEYRDQLELVSEIRKHLGAIGGKKDYDAAAKAIVAFIKKHGHEDKRLLKYSQWSFLPKPVLKRLDVKDGIIRGLD